MEAPKVNATRDQLEAFRSSVLWNDFVTELTAWQKGFNIEMLSIVDDAAAENPSTASVLLHMGDLNGRQKAVEYFLSLPDVFLDLLEQQKEDKDLEVSDE